MIKEEVDLVRNHEHLIVPLGEIKKSLIIAKLLPLELLWSFSFWGMITNNFSILLNRGFLLGHRIWILRPSVL